VRLGVRLFRLVNVITLQCLLSPGQVVTFPPPPNFGFYVGKHEDLGCTFLFFFACLRSSVLLFVLLQGFAFLGAASAGGRQVLCCLVLIRNMFRLAHYFFGEGAPCPPPS